MWLCVIMDGCTLRLQIEDQIVSDIDDIAAKIDFGE